MYRLRLYNKFIGMLERKLNMAKKFNVNNGEVRKQAFYKQKWFKVIAVIFVLGIIRDMFLSDEHSKTESRVENVKSESGTKTKPSIAEVEEKKKSFQLIAGELGEFGKKLTMNEGTDMPEDLIVYYLPVGTYEVENIGSFPAQVMVYEGFKRNDETGYDDYTNMGDVKRIEVGKKDTIEVPSGWFVEIHEPVKLELTKR